MTHIPTCRRYMDDDGRWWHSAVCETPEQNYRYALAVSGSREYARAIVSWLFAPVRTIREAALMALRSEDAKVWERALWRIGVGTEAR